MRIALHLGVHKTATTYLQTVFDANRAELEAGGVGYIPMRPFRTAITANLGLPLPELRERVATLLKPASIYERIVISDENIIGQCEIFREDSYYSTAAQRVAKLIEALKGHEVEVFIASRSYEHFVSSMYCEFIRHHPFVTPDEYVGAADVGKLNWFELVGDLAEIVGPERVTFWRFEDFRDVEQRVLSLMAEGSSIDKQKPDGPLWESHSQTAIHVLSALRRLIGRKRTRLFVGRIGRLFSKGRGFRAFRAFSADDALALSDRYERDLALLRREYPALHFLDPVAEHRR